MIGKISIGKGFAGCLSYCLNNKDKTKDLPPRAEILHFNLLAGDLAFAEAPAFSF